MRHDPVLDPRNEVFCVKTVSSIPMNMKGAIAAIKSIATKHNQSNKLSEPSNSVSELPELEENLIQESEVLSTSNPKVKIASDMDSRSASPVHSVTSSIHSGEVPTESESLEDQQIARTLMPRLSFWSVLPRRRTTEPGQVLDQQPPKTQIPLTDSIPALQETLRKSYPGPSTDTERRNELDDKILKECIREFTKGVVFFSYNIGDFLFHFASFVMILRNLDLTNIETLQRRSNTSEQSSRGQTNVFESEKQSQPLRLEGT